MASAVVLLLLVLLIAFNTAAIGRADAPSQLSAATVTGITGPAGLYALDLAGVCP